MKALKIILSVTGGFFLVLIVLVIIGYRPPREEQHLVSMEESGAAMGQAGQTMLTYGQELLERGRQSGDQNLVAHGQHWLTEGQDLVKRGQQMSMNPLASDYLQSSRPELAAQGNWTELVRNTEAMIHNPQSLGATNLNALRSNGDSMVSEGKTMAEHGRVMAGEIEILTKQQQLSPTVTNELQQAAQTIRQVGEHLMQNGQTMVNYVIRQQQNIGSR